MDYAKVSPFSTLTNSRPFELHTCTVLYLYNNVLTRPILGEVSEMKNLKDLQIHLNHFSGSIPSTLGELKQLEALSLRGNLLTGTYCGCGKVGVYYRIRADPTKL